MSEDFFSPLFKNKQEKIYHYFNGKEWKESTSGKTVPILSPIDQSPVGYVQAVTKEEINEVISHAKAAQSAWNRTPFFTRIKIVSKAVEYLREYATIYAESLIVEIGKTRKESMSEVLRTADLVDYFAREAQSVTGEFIESDRFPGFEKGKFAVSERVAHGIVLAIGPFNYPINLVASKIAPGLLMGNAVVVKPPTQGSIAGLMLTEAFLQAGVPEGVLSCVTGEGKEIGDVLVMHHDIQMIAFTGSSAVGESLANKSGMKTLLLECGGNNPVIVLPDADMDLTSKEIVKGGFSFSGQRCTGIKYVLGQKAILEQLVPLVIEDVKNLTSVGDPREDTTKLMGPVISLKAAEEIEKSIQDAVKAGAIIAHGGKRNGTFIEPTLLINVNAQMEVVREEIFGPVISFIEVSDANEAVHIVNNSKFGLQASIFTKDEGLGIKLASEINVGTVQVNGSPQRGPDHFPFTGVKVSGLGVQGVRHSLESMSRLKSIVVNNPS